MPKKIVVRERCVSVWVSAPMLRPRPLGAVRGPDMNLSVSYSHDSPLRSGHLLAALSTSPPVDVRYRNRPRDQVPVPGPPANVLRRFTVAKGPLLAFRGVARGRDSLAPPDQGINLMACLRRIAMTIPQVVRLVLATTSRGTRLTTAYRRPALIFASAEELGTKASSRSAFSGVAEVFRCWCRSRGSGSTYSNPVTISPAA